MRAIKHCYQCLAAAFRAPVPMFVSALICVINCTQKKEERPNPGRGKGSLGWDGAKARACARWPVTAEPFAEPFAASTAKILTVSTQRHGGFPAAQPGPLLLAGGQGRWAQGRGGQGHRCGQGEAATVIWGWAGPEDGAEDLEKGNGSCRKEGKGRSQGEKAVGSPWGWSSPARGGQPAGGTTGGVLKRPLNIRSCSPGWERDRVTCCSAWGSCGGGEGRKEGGKEGRKERGSRKDGGRMEQGRKERGRREEEERKDKGGRKERGREGGGKEGGEREEGGQACCREVLTRADSPLGRRSTHAVLDGASQGSVPGVTLLGRQARRLLILLCYTGI